MAGWRSENALELAARLGKSLVGKKVMTMPYGEWPGGIAEVTRMWPDKAAPEIVFEVSMPGQDDIGVFEHETVGVMIT